MRCGYTFDVIERLWRRRGVRPAEARIALGDPGGGRILTLFVSRIPLWLLENMA